MIHSKHSSLFFSLFLVILLFASCEKVNISFGDTASDTDPNVTYIEGSKVDIATYNTDSFLTSSHSIFSLGYHTDPDFGVIRARSFAQINLPSSNTVYDNVKAVFDSLELIIKPNGQFYGDSNVTMKLAVHRLTENIENDENSDYFYNTSSFRYDPVPIGEGAVNLYGKSGTDISVRLSDQLGREWLEKLKANDIEVSSNDAFLEYFKGICITTDSVQTSSLAYFTASDSMLIRLTYHETGLDPGEKYLNFSFVSGKQFNKISFTPGNANFSSFISNKTQLIASSASGNKSFLNTAVGSVIKISFPDLLKLKELHPYVKVMKAILLVKPDPSSSLFPYQLPAALNLYSTDETNAVISAFYDNSTTPALLTGNLYVDALYGENTSYSYDITSFINTKMTEGQFSKSALLLYPSVSSLDAGLQRLIVNDQTASRSVQLKLYVLGL